MALLALLCLGFPALVCSQQPVHFVIGSEELANVEVYSLHQGADEILYAATDHGLYEYKHGRFKQIPAPALQRSSSLFNLLRDRDGRLFCSNLSGQVFVLEEGELKLYHEVDPSMISSQFTYGFDAANDLIYASRSLTRVSGPDKKEEPLAGPADGSGFYTLFNFSDGSLAALYASQDSVWVAAMDGAPAQTFAIQHTSGLLVHNYHLVKLGASIIAINVSGEVCLVNGPVCRQDFAVRTRERIFQFADDELLCLDFSKGGRTIRLKDGSLKEEDILFEEHFISTIARGTRNNLFFGTFGEGVFVVPNRQARRINTDMVNGQLRGISPGEAGELFVTSRSGELFRYTDKMELLSVMEGQPLGRVYDFPGMDLGFNADFPGLLHDSKDGFGSLKNAFALGDSAVMTSTSVGVYRMGKKSPNEVIWQEVNPRAQVLRPFRERCYAAISDDRGEQLYVATSNRLYALEQEGNRREIKFQGLSLNCNDLLWDRGELIAATQKHGLLFFRGDSVVRQIDQRSGLSDNFVSKMVRVGRKLYLGHQQGVPVIDLDNREIKTFGLAEGVPPGPVRDLAVTADQMWLVVEDDLLSIRLDERTIKSTPLEIIIDSVVVAGQRLPTQDGEAASFAYDQNRVEFHVDFRIVEFLEEARFMYQLEGLDEDWQYAPVRESSIAYRALPPGDFRFQIKVVCRDAESETFSWKFSIMPPFWRQWWFYVLSTLAIILVVGLGFGYRIRQIRKTNRERLHRQEMEKNLVESKLKALRSQMNPHFIFNSLNSIQDLILRQDTDRAYDYVVLFADLVRNTLHYSEQGYISIEEELEFLNTYLSLEHLRFKDSFSYKLSYEDTEAIEIPSMIVQPFIENALQHGLLHQSGHRRLEVSFELGEVLVCTVSDNGIGREEARKIRDRQGGRHESFSLDAIRQRMEFLEQQDAGKAGFSIEDLYEDGKAAGTRVTIRLSYRRLY